MKTTDYLDAAKERLGITSDYALAQRLDFKKQEVSRWRKGDVIMSPYACIKIAITLNLDPAQVLAEVHEETEKNPKKRAFWSGFLSRAVLVLLMACTLGLSSFVMPENAQAASGGTANSGYGLLRIIWIMLIKILK
ncbi:protein of unknown function [Sterolibacterium denitrificans]|uniref:HTH cro/C1-type domain-containing protein n=1 Tax=Sterolibacterium denitrificans TaxID=157592 RepID=A0A7Z7HRE5_9PROT|nr:hypothetical protein [Sterolibacterium denitrificans]SMB27286.1 protein of unknown function [Sterolibacterium denitrificans]